MTQQIWTASRLKAYQTCPCKEAFRYREKLAPIRTRSVLAFGTAIHKGLETRSIEQALDVLMTDYPKDQSEADAQDIAATTVQALLSNYFDRYEPFETEKPELLFKLPMLTWPHGNKSKTFFIAGKLDNFVQIDGRWWVVEYKTASRLDASYFDRLYVDSQITMYVTAMRRMGYDVAGVIYRVIRKPTLKRTAKESLVQFEHRLFKDIYDRPDFYFTEKKLYRSLDDIDEFEAMVYHTARMANQNCRNGRCYKHSVACSMYGGCEYLPICTGVSGAYDLYEHREPHEELREDTSNEVAND